MQSGNRVTLSLNIGNIDAHSVVMHSIVKETITKVNGNIFENIYIELWILGTVVFIQFQVMT